MTELPSPQPSSSSDPAAGEPACESAAGQPVKQTTSGSPQQTNDALLHRFDMSAMSLRDLRRAILDVPVPETEGREEEALVAVKVSGARGQHNALMRIEHPVEIAVEGNLGDYAFALSDRTEFRVTGDVGHGVGEGLSGGRVQVNGNAGDAVGAAISGGTIAIYGNAGHRCGGAMRAGGVFVRGNVGDECGIGALGGIIVIGGDAGENLGDAMNNATVFIRGRAASLAPGVTEAPLRKREELRLGLLLINASIRSDSKEFRRIVPEAVLAAEVASRGEVNPNWR